MKQNTLACDGILLLSQACPVSISIPTKLCSIL